MSNDSVLIPYGKWLRNKKLIDAPMSKIIVELWIDYEHEVTEKLRLAGSLLTRPEPQRIKTVIDVTNAAAQMLEIKKTYSVPDGLVIEVVNSPLNREPLPIQQPVVMVSAKRKHLNTAIELLEACSEDLFISGDDAELEARVDKFLKEVKQS